MNRSELNRRYLTFGEIKIESSDYDFLNLFDDYKKFIEQNKDKELFYGDLGNDYHTCWAVYYYEDNTLVGTAVRVSGCRNCSETLQNETVKNKIKELTKDEVIKPEKKKGQLDFGKYIFKDVKTILKDDLQYIDWCLVNKKGFDKFIIKLIDDTYFNEQEVEILNYSIKNSYSKRILENEKNIKSYEKCILKYKTENYEFSLKIDELPSTRELQSN